MNTKLVLAFLLVSAAVIVVQCQDEDCPDPVMCLVDPCLTARCPRFLNAECRANFCGGTCTADFFRRGRRNVTAVCPSRTGTCEERVCPGGRMCMEEAVPSRCLPGDSRCRQYLYTRCVFPPEATECTPGFCQQPGRTCVVVRTNLGPRARCLLLRPQSCAEIEPCPEGFECRFRDRGDDRRPVVRCVEQPPQSCSDIECTGGTVCVVGRSRAKCILPRTCEHLQCGANGDGTVCVPGTPPRCVPDPMRVCSDTDIAACAERSQACVIQFPSGDSECVPARSCDELPQCPTGTECIVLMLGGNPLAACLAGPIERSCDDLDCADDEVCVSTTFPSREASIAACYPVESSMLPPTCTFNEEELCAGVEGDFLCLDSRQNGQQADALCVQVNCTSDSDCTLRGRFSLDSCTPIPSDNTLSVSASSLCLEASTTLEFGMAGCPNRLQRCPAQFTCENGFSEGVLYGNFCNILQDFPPDSCDDVVCGEGEECVVNCTGQFVEEAFCTLSTVADQILAQQ